jgi:thiosulfate reductase cytochrome b subunit
MHYAEPKSSWIPFDVAVSVHNLCGIGLSLLYFSFVVGNLITGNFWHYIPRLRGLSKRMIGQIRYYLYGIFMGEPHPHHPSLKDKFNALQQLTYLQIMYLLMPVLIITGLFLLFPEYAPDKFLGAGGIWPMAIMHSVAGFFGSLFMIGHIYLATTGETPLANIKGMLNGWHNIESH